MTIGQAERDPYLPDVASLKFGLNPATAEKKVGKWPEEKKILTNSKQCVSGKR